MSEKNGDEQKKEEAFSAPYSIPDSLPGLNIREGLKRLGGAWSVYADLVRFFCEDKRHFFKKFKEVVKKKDFKTASIMAHSLKGSAATIAAAELSHNAKRLEKICEKEDIKQIMDVLQTVEDTFIYVIESSEKIIALIESSEDRTEPDKKEYDLSKLPELFKEFDKSLQEFDPLESESWLAEIKGCFDVGDFDEVASALLQVLIQQTNNYEFDKARKILHELRSLVMDDG